MQKEYLQPFLEGVESVYKAYFKIKIQTNNIAIENKIDMKEDLVVAIGIKGDLEGMVLLCIDQEDALRLGNYELKRQGMIKEDGEWGEIHESILQEFTNQITGKVVALYEKMGKACKLSTPRYVKEEEKATFKEESIRYEIISDVAKLVLKLYIH